MLHSNLLIVFGLLATALVATADDARRVIEFADLDGKLHAPMRQSDRKATVLFFLLPDCPISNAYAPEINRIASEYAKRDVACFVVYVDPDLSADDARKHASEFGYDIPVLRDTRLELAKQAGATIAPEAGVLDAHGKIRYRGRIDDLYVDYGKRRVQPSQRDLRLALDAILAGRPVPRETTKAIGCHIAQPTVNHP